MTAAQRYILDEAKAIEKECLERSISVGEWIERYAEDYRKRYWNNNRQTVSLGRENHRYKSRWTAWLERVNNT